MSKKTLKIEIDLEPIIDDINKYIKRKIQQHIRENYLEENVEVDFPDIHFPDIEKRLEKAEEWIEDLKSGWIKLQKKDE